MEGEVEGRGDDTERGEKESDLAHCPASCAQLREPSPLLLPSLSLLLISIQEIPLRHTKYHMNYIDNYFMHTCK